MSRTMKYTMSDEDRAIRKEKLTILFASINRHIKEIETRNLPDLYLVSKGFQEEAPVVFYNPPEYKKKKKPYYTPWY